MQISTEVLGQSQNTEDVLPANSSSEHETNFDLEMFKMVNKMVNKMGEKMGNKMVTRVASGDRVEQTENRRA